MNNEFLKSWQSLAAARVLVSLDSLKAWCRSTLSGRASSGILSSRYSEYPTYSPERFAMSRLASIHTLDSPIRNVSDETWRARVHLAAANRLAVHDELDEGIDNHFTMTVPGRNDRFMVLPFGRHWSEARASDLIVFDETGKVLDGDGDGEGDLELSAFCIHAPLHRISGAKVILHTHQTWALALNMLQDNRLLPGSQTAAFFARNVAYDDGYTGLAAELSEGERLAAILGDKQILFMKNHGVLVVGETVAQAYRRLYKLEKVCKVQVLALSTGRPLALLSEALVERVDTLNPKDSHSRTEREQLYFAAMMRVLDRVNPGYAD